VKRGDCFEVAGRLVLAVDGVVLVHGRVVGASGPLTGVEHWHAWVEYDEVVPFPDGRRGALRLVVDRSNGHDVTLPAEYYYEVGQVRRTHRYERGQALAQMVRHEHWGPWDD